ncbi:Hypothetical protein NTJ_02924 [Nesidiocoris tenuis]|uniref:Uncharacterized protein n=1 Tax=Nesidiocoris tenuis TaxID=355587 RepID=A0ABN7ACU0_9HEMI|nr:Hypothetical protein NTJ_02924 [Nesidiocoris tenuis]
MSLSATRDDRAAKLPGAGSSLKLLDFIYGLPRRPLPRPSAATVGRPRAPPPRADLITLRPLPHSKDDKSSDIFRKRRRKGHLPPVADQPSLLLG